MAEILLELHQLLFVAATLDQLHVARGGKPQLAKAV
jgi:hypothetical protein